VTRDVFAPVWEHPDAYDPRQGPRRGWLAGLAHRLAVQRLRVTETAALARGGPGTTEELEHKVRHASVAARADYIVQSMPVPLRAALELAYFQRRDYRQTAADLGVTEDEARRRLRLGLHLLPTAHDTEAPGGPPGIGGAAGPATASPPATAPSTPDGRPPGRRATDTAPRAPARARETGRTVRT